VNTKQKVAVLASGLAIATTGFVVADAQAANAGDPEAQPASAAVSIDSIPAGRPARTQRT
jgi:hypothetical protein